MLTTHRIALLLLAPTVLTVVVSCTADRQRCSDSGTCANGLTCTLSGSDGICVDLRSEEKYPGPCTSRFYRPWGEEELGFEYAYDEQDQLIGCERIYYDKETGDGGREHMHFFYNDDGSLASLETDEFGPFDDYEAVWTFTPTGSRLEGTADGRDFVITYEADAQFDSLWPQDCDPRVEAPGSRLERTELLGQSSTTTYYSYDGPRAPGTRTQLASSEDGSTSLTRISYDQESRLVRLERDGGSGYENSYDERGLWTSHRTFEGNSSPSEQLLFYDRAGNIRASARVGRFQTSHTFYTYDCW